MVAASHPDLVLLDVNLPDINGFEVCRRIKSDPATARIPVVHISAFSLESAHQTLGFDSGADNYLTEPVEPEVLLAAVRAALRARQAEESMRELALQWQTTFDAMGDGVALLDADGRILRWNRKLEELTGRRAGQLSRHYCYRLWDRADQQPEKAAFLSARESCRREEMDVKFGGRWLHVTVDPMLDEETGEFHGAVYIVADTTERRTLEEQFREAQKFESIGQLAGGVAHDFNNLLTSILGNAGLVLNDLDAEHPLRDRIEDIAAAGNRAAELTRQLLA
jgi:PAS domain S-box-containing protein